MSLLELVESVDNFSYQQEGEQYFTLLSHDSKAQLGYVLPLVVDKLIQVDTESLLIVNRESKTLKIGTTLDQFDKRNEYFALLAQRLRDLNVFDTLKGWRDERYVVYYPEHTPYLLAERSFCPLLGVVMYGVHINGYIPAHLSKRNQLEFWVPRRSIHKQTFPGMLDNTIAGGLGYPYGVFETVLKESYEEAGIPEEFVKRNIKQVGAISYMFSHKANDFETESGLIQPEMEYIYDLEFDSNTVPIPVDNEAENFELLTLDEVLVNLHAKKFKPNCALVIIDFLIRHGTVTAENEPDYLEINARIHRRLPFPLK